MILSKELKREQELLESFWAARRLSAALQNPAFLVPLDI